MCELDSPLFLTKMTDTIVSVFQGSMRLNLYYTPPASISPSFTEEMLAERFINGKNERMKVNNPFNTAPDYGNIPVTSYDEYWYADREGSSCSRGPHHRFADPRTVKKVYSPVSVIHFDSHSMHVGSCCFFPFFFFLRGWGEHAVGGTYAGLDSEGCLEACRVRGFS